MILSSNLAKFHAELGIKKTIDVLSVAGFQGIDFNTDIEEYHTDAHGPEFYKEIRAYAADKGISFYQTHAPYRTNFPDPVKTEQRFREIVKSMEFSTLLGAEMTVVHPYKHFENWETMSRDAVMEGNFAFYKRLLPYAETHGLKIAIENIHGYITATAEDLIELVDSLGSELFTVCFDVGHANIAKQNPGEMIRKLGGRLGCTHIHDNDGINDLHTLPYYYNTIDWEDVMKALADADYQGNLNYEAARFVSNVPTDFLQTGADYMAAVGKRLISRFQYYKNTL